VWPESWAAKTKWPMDMLPTPMMGPPGVGNGHYRVVPIPQPLNLRVPLQCYHFREGAVAWGLPRSSRAWPQHKAHQDSARGDLTPRFWQELLGCFTNITCKQTMSLSAYTHVVTKREFCPTNTLQIP